MKTPNHNACEKGGFSQFYIAHNVQGVCKGMELELLQLHICSVVQ